MNIGEILLGLWNKSGFAQVITGFVSNNGWQNLVMLVIACVLLYLAIVKKFEPLLLVGIAFGCLLTNLPGAGLYNQALWDAYVQGVPYTNAAGEVIVSGLSTWVIMDMDSRSLISGESRGITVAGEEEGRLHPQRKVSVPEGGSEFALTPSADQIDRNGHMNNAAYLDAVEPMLPEEYRGRELRAIAVDYEHEILPGRHAAVRAVAQGESCFFEGSMEGRTCFRISETFAV